ncbi:terminal organelle protein P200 [Mycoplasmoides pneumoniae]|uniref:terminal organelle protein P200 n=1 Tax=Mycoplasmoides pneumoniae TaxID=2104 RepID=UPI00056F432C|nr:terminal organelle protein P200 [Mycoplasmoides pneumoniae]ALA30442.1 hypothetical protein C897_03245 [Mycoplasmoides pneumoniae PI 1428]ALA32547.1 hypothetical protein F533_03240 [Mycoplasmoides pneumoniae 51494]ALA33248.1 hypothetical protein F530_03250 [Mycoplasmoides pneumoniae 54089]ALA33952.1 hypothetical protein F531_03245 [Mycoplasmoides pneumoniae 54524]ALA34669.1 hypothetical protein F537_03245 [Mycoplasmoides pneumoniae 85084]
MPKTIKKQNPSNTTLQYKKYLEQSKEKTAKAKNKDVSIDDLLKKPFLEEIKTNVLKKNKTTRASTATRGTSKVKKQIVESSIDFFDEKKRGVFIVPPAGTSVINDDRDDNKAVEETVSKTAISQNQLAHYANSELVETEQFELKPVALEHNQVLTSTRHSQERESIFEKAQLFWQIFVGDVRFGFWKNHTWIWLGFFDQHQNWYYFEVVETVELPQEHTAFIKRKQIDSCFWKPLVGNPNYGYIQNNIWVWKGFFDTKLNWIPDPVRFTLPMVEKATTTTPVVQIELPAPPTVTVVDQTSPPTAAVTVSTSQPVIEEQTTVFNQTTQLEQLSVSAPLLDQSEVETEMVEVPFVAPSTTTTQPQVVTVQAQPASSSIQFQEPIIKVEFVNESFDFKKPSQTAAAASQAPSQAINIALNEADLIDELVAVGTTATTALPQSELIQEVVVIDNGQPQQAGFHYVVDFLTSTAPLTVAEIELQEQELVNEFVTTTSRETTTFASTPVFEPVVIPTVEPEEQLLENEFVESTVVSATSNEPNVASTPVVETVELTETPVSLEPLETVQLETAPVVTETVTVTEKAVEPEVLAVVEEAPLAVEPIVETSTTLAAETVEEAQVEQESTAVAVEPAIETESKATSEAQAELDWEALIGNSEYGYFDAEQNWIWTGYFDEDNKWVSTATAQTEANAEEVVLTADAETSELNTESDPSFEPEVEIQPEPEPNFDLETIPEPESIETTEPEPNFEPEVELEPEIEPNFESETEVQQELAQESSFESEPEPNFETEVEVQPESEIESKFEAEVQSEPKVSLNSDFETKPEAQAEVTPETLEVEATSEAPELQPETEATKVVDDVEEEQLDWELLIGNSNYGHYEPSGEWVWAGYFDDNQIWTPDASVEWARESDYTDLIGDEIYGRYNRKGEWIWYGYYDETGEWVLVDEHYQNHQPRISEAPRFWEQLIGNEDYGYYEDNEWKWYDGEFDSEGNWLVFHSSNAEDAKNIDIAKDIPVFESFDVDSIDADEWLDQFSDSDAKEVFGED